MHMHVYNVATVYDKHDLIGNDQLYGFLTEIIFSYTFNVTVCVYKYQ